MNPAAPQGPPRGRENPRGRGNPRARRRFSPLTRRILAVNLLALAVPVAGLLYLGEYRQTLIDDEIQELKVQAGLFAGAIGEAAVTAHANEQHRQILGRDISYQMIRRLIEGGDTRGRIFHSAGPLAADSRTLTGIRGAVEIESLPPPGESDFLNTVLGGYDRVTAALARRPAYPPYLEPENQHARDYAEVVSALGGRAAGAVRALDKSGDLILSVAVPLQRYKQVVGALMLSKTSHGVDEALFEVRTNILRVSGAAFIFTALMSLYLAGAITRPIRRLAQAADRVRAGRHERGELPDFKGRNDEIGDLAAALRDMTDALWARMDAIESFAADVSHEIKNPLTSLRSAVETAARVRDPEQQRKLMSIIQEDVRRLDRLITDISGASRLDAELSRAETESVDIAAMLRTLADVRAGAETGAPQMALSGLQSGAQINVNGIESRFVQVFQNLIGNAVSFTPPGGAVRIHVSEESLRRGGFVTVTIDNDGPGIPPGKEEAIFQRFYSERPEGEPFGAHSGLGLSIARQIVEAYGGTLTAENRPQDEDGDKDGGAGAGARFTIRLPVTHASG